MNALDRLLNKLAQEPPDWPLDHLEADVWQGIHAAAFRRLQARFDAKMYAAAVSFALLAGALMGGMEVTSMSRAHHELSIFSAKTDLAPSTLLEGRG